MRAAWEALARVGGRTERDHHPEPNKVPNDWANTGAHLRHMGVYHDAPVLDVPEPNKVPEHMRIAATYERHTRRGR